MYCIIGERLRMAQIGSKEGWTLFRTRTLIVVGIAVGLPLPLYKMDHKFEQQHQHNSVDRLHICLKDV